MRQLLGFYHEPNCGETYLSHIFLQEISFPMELEGGVAQDENDLPRVANETFEEWEIVPGTDSEPTPANDPQVMELLGQLDREITAVNRQGLPTSDLTSPLDQLWEILAAQPPTHRIGRVIKDLLDQLPTPAGDPAPEVVQRARTLIQELDKAKAPL